MEITHVTSRMIATTLSPPLQPSLSSVSLSKSGIGRRGEGRRLKGVGVGVKRESVPSLSPSPSLLPLLTAFFILQAMKAVYGCEELRNRGNGDKIGWVRKIKMRATEGERLL